MKEERTSSEIIIELLECKKNYIESRIKELQDELKQLNEIILNKRDGK